MDDPMDRLSQALDEDYKEWLIPSSPSAEKVESRGFSTDLNKERLGISCLQVFLLSLASDARLPSAADLSRLVANLFAFAQSKRLTILGVITEFESVPGSEYYVRELLLWPLTSQAASRLAACRKMDDNEYFVRNRQSRRIIHKSKLGLFSWDDSIYDPDHIVDRKDPLKKARMSSSSVFGEENFAEENTWRRVWKIERKGTDRERLAKCLDDLLKES